MQLKTQTRDNNIETALRAFSGAGLRAASIDLLNTLGYKSEKTLDLDGSSAAFLEQFDTQPDRAFAKDKALFKDWKEIQLLFQLTDQELGEQNKLFVENEVKQGLMSSYLFFAIELNKQDYARGKLIAIARQLNRVFPMPVMVLIKHGGLLSVAVINRRQNKRDSEKDVLGKVTIIRDISLVEPHPGHIQILSSFALQNLTGINNFDALHTAWEEILNVELLNKKFYNELSNWYFWAINEVSFPGEPTIQSFFNETGSNDEAKLKEAIQQHNAKNVIRLLTRFLFVWFIKEKQLIPNQLFDLDYLQKEMLKDLSPYHEDGLFKSVNVQSHYYKAILQNLFFATLNKEMGKRAYRRSGQNMNVTNLLRYENCFKHPEKFIELAENHTPFMNGGLFECLDKPHPTKKGPKGGDVIIHEDGFSDRTDNPLKVPDYLFFGHDEDVDLSNHFDSKAKKYKQAAVKGLINIFNSYKFTITENTPIEQEIALDPELLGKVFENLLASYNPETKTTARKQTGSFYTPREIVGYMVDESLIAYLKNEVEDWGVDEEALDTKLHELLSYDDSNPFHENQSLQKKIIQALNRCKILDPACGSGAFPMGILQKMVHILQKVDPDNTYWQELQMDNALKETETVFHIDDKEAREQKLIEINEAFDQKINAPDYARKLFLIENCIYGVDIQPIATQISKLRFFISLVVDQKVDKSKDNFGIRPLPNLETKFVAANTLIGIDNQDGQMTLDNPDIKKLESELIDIRHRIFSAKTPPTKRKYRDEDKRIREEMGELLIADGWASKTANQLVGWDPYDQNMSSGFFDPEWMFGIMDGFDVVIGNPPYGFHHIHSKELKTYFKKNYHAASGSFENYFLFYEKSLNLLKPGGAHSFIVPVTWLTIPSAYSLRKYILNNFHISHISWFNDVVFESAQVNNLVSLIKSSTDNNVRVSIYGDAISLKDHVDKLIIPQKKFIEADFYISIFENEVDTRILDMISQNSTALGELCKPCSGYNPYEVGKGVAPDGKPHTRQTVKEKPYHSKSKKGNDWKPEVIGRNLSRYNVTITGERWIKYGPWLAAERNPENFRGKRILVQEIVGGSERRIIAAFYDGELYHSRDVIPIKINSNSPNPYVLLAVINSSLLTWYHHKRSPKAKKGLFPKVLVSDLKKLPIANVRDKNQAILIIQLVTFMRHAKSINNESAFNLFDEIIDGLVYQLYFPDHMKEKQIDIFQYVEKDLAEVIQERDFEKLHDNEKENILNQLHTKWTHPDSEVRNRIKLFAVRSPDILKPILESR